ncbi:hypothetical protein IKQ19_21050, partial [Candidatus Saccharibacteria bacterium]|nr:hypothetical protein [Candidatus Saccharibacteria bacterium]
LQAKTMPLFTIDVKMPFLRKKRHFTKINKFQKMNNFTISVKDAKSFYIKCKTITMIGTTKYSK